jgi:hypothetical protein
MAPPQTDSPPSPWAAIQDFAKNVVTLAGALIGLTVTFASQLLGKTDDPTRTSLYFAWGFAVVAIAFGVASHGFVVAYLKNGTRSTPAIFCSNAAFVFLTLAALTFALFGYFAVGQKTPITAVAAVQLATDSAPALVGDKNSKWHLKSLNYDAANASFNIVVLQDNSSVTLDLLINSKGLISKVQKP